MKAMASPSSRTDAAAGVLTLAGFAALVTGVWWLSPAGALIVAGVVLLAAAQRMAS